jgi:phospholipase C
MKTNRNFYLCGVVSLAAAMLIGSGCATHKDDAGSTTSTSATMTAPAVATPAPAPVATPAPAADPVKVTLKLVKVDSEETAGEDGKGANAVDGNTETFWHTQWQDDTPACPHEIIIELVPPATIKGLTYLPRQDGSDHGNIKDYEVYAGDDAENFGQPVAKGAFGEGPEQKTVTFEPKTCHFIKLKALSEINGEAWTSAAEIGVVQ